MAPVLQAVRGHGSPIAPDAAPVLEVRPQQPPRPASGLTEADPLAEIGLAGHALVPDAHLKRLARKQEIDFRGAGFRDLRLQVRGTCLEVREFEGELLGGQVQRFAGEPVRDAAGNDFPAVNGH